jgi:hypothetical protein
MSCPKVTAVKQRTDLDETLYDSHTQSFVEIVLLCFVLLLKRAVKFMELSISKIKGITRIPVPAGSATRKNCPSCAYISVTSSLYKQK